MAKGGGTQTMAPDPATQQYQEAVRGAAGAAANSPPPGLSPYTQSAADYFGGMMKGGNLGFSALTGDPTAVDSFMNPYQKNVVDAMNTQYGDIRKNTMSDVNDAATQAGAFGGSRHGVATGVALGQVDKDQASQLAQLYSSGFDSAMGRAGAAANLGFGAAGAQAGLGEYARNVAQEQDPAYWRLKMLSQVPFGATGQTATGQGGHNPISGAIGGMGAGAALGWPGAIAGGLLGLFS